MIPKATLKIAARVRTLAPDHFGKGKMDIHGFC
jgi:hypothetical protein